MSFVGVQHKNPTAVPGDSFFLSQHHSLPVLAELPFLHLPGSARDRIFPELIPCAFPSLSTASLPSEFSLKTQHSEDLGRSEGTDQDKDEEETSLHSSHSACRVNFDSELSSEGL